MLIFGLLLMGKLSLMMFPITVKPQLKHPYLRNYPKISKNVVSNLQVLLQFCHFYKLQVWLTTMRMIVNGRGIK